MVIAGLLAADAPAHPRELGPDRALSTRIHKE